MKRRSSIGSRIERLEALQRRRTNAAEREALIVLCVEDCAEKHLETANPPESSRWIFEQMPGPGPQLEDFGEFGTVVWFTPAEWEA